FFAFNLSLSRLARTAVWGRRCGVCFIVVVPAYSRSGGSSTASRLSAGGSVTAIGVAPPGLSSSLSGRCASAHLLKPFSWLVVSEIYMTLVLMLQKVEVTAGGPPRAVVPVRRPSVTGSGQPPEARTSPVAVARSEERRVGKECGWGGGCGCGR